MVTQKEEKSKKQIKYKSLVRCHTFLISFKRTTLLLSTSVSGLRHFLGLLVKLGKFSLLLLRLRSFRLKPVQVHNICIGSINTLTISMKKEKVSSFLLARVPAPQEHQKKIKTSVTN